jgi:hypothetical protein
MPKMVCTTCCVELVPRTNGVVVVEMFNEPPQPYQLWNADAWVCPVCQFEIIAGFAHDPYAEHWQPDFEKHLTVLLNSPLAERNMIVCAFEHVGDAPRYVMTNPAGASDDQTET